MFIRLAPNTFTPPSNFPKIMFAGDSTTWDGNYAGDRSGWKRPFAKLVFDEYKYWLRNGLEIVGKDADSNSNRDVYSCCGYPAMRSDQLLASYVGTGSDSLQASTYQPDCVMLLIGLNDVYQDYNGAASAPHSHVTDMISDIIDSFYVANPDCTIFVGTLTDGSTFSSESASCNTYIQTMLEARSEYSDTPSVGKISIVDVRGAIGVYSVGNANYYSDGKHISNAGNLLVAQAWFDAFQTAFNDIILDL